MLAFLASVNSHGGSYHMCKPVSTAAGVLICQKQPQQDQRQQGLHVACSAAGIASIASMLAFLASVNSHGGSYHMCKPVSTAAGVLICQKQPQPPTLSTDIATARQQAAGCLEKGPGPACFRADRVQETTLKHRARQAHQDSVAV